MTSPAKLTLDEARALARKGDAADLDRLLAVLVDPNYGDDRDRELFFDVIRIDPARAIPKLMENVKARDLHFNFLFLPLLENEKGALDALNEGPPRGKTFTLTAEAYARALPPLESPSACEMTCRLAERFEDWTTDTGFGLSKPPSQKRHTLAVPVFHDMSRMDAWSFSMRALNVAFLPAAAPYCAGADALSKKALAEWYHPGNVSVEKVSGTRRTATAVELADNLEGAYDALMSQWQSGMRSSPEGASARSVVAAYLLYARARNGGNAERRYADLQAAIRNFNEHSPRLRAHRMRDGAHTGTHGMSPYYYDVTTEYAADAVAVLARDADTPGRKLFAERARRHGDGGNPAYHSRAFATALLGLGYASLCRSEPVPPTDGGARPGKSH